MPTKLFVITCLFIWITACYKLNKIMLNEIKVFCFNGWGGSWMDAHVCAFYVWKVAVDLKRKKF